MIFMCYLNLAICSFDDSHSNYPECAILDNNVMNISHLYVCETGYAILGLMDGKSRGRIASLHRLWLSTLLHTGGSSCHQPTTGFFFTPAEPLTNTRGSHFCHDGEHKEICLRLKVAFSWRLLALIAFSWHFLVIWRSSPINCLSDHI